MTETHDPIRLSELGDGAFEELQLGLRTARLQGPSVVQRAHVRAALGLAVASAPKPSATPPRSPSSNAGDATLTSGRAHLLLLKRVLAATLAAVAALGLEQRVARGPSAEQSARSRVENTAPAVLRRIEALPAASNAPAERSSELAAGARPPAALTAAPAAGGSAVQALPRREASPRRQPSERARAAQTRAFTDPPSELALLKHARAEARFAPDRALALIALHQARYPAPAFAEEREVIAVDALLAAGRTAEAEQRASDFVVHFPSSAHTRRIRVLLDGDSDKKPPHPKHAGE